MTADALIDEAMQFFRLAQEAESTNRAEALDDLRFRIGEQWPVEIQNSRKLEARPCLTINKVDAYVRQVVNEIRQQRPRMKAHGVNTEADAKIAELITGICRHIEVNSDADQAYDTAVEHAVTGGWGYFRLVADYVNEKSFDQELFIRPIDNPFSVYFDPNSVAPDGSDCERCLITETISKRAFAVYYPDHAEDMTAWQLRGTGDQDPEWVSKEDVRVAEFYRIERKLDTLCLLSNGKTAWADDYGPHSDTLKKAGIEKVSERTSFRHIVKWAKLTAFAVLEERDLPGRFIPVIPVYGNQAMVEGKRKRFGLVRFAKDPQRMYNFWRTAMTESVALAPKAKWVMAEGQDEGHENEWAMANVAAKPVLRYKTTDVDGREAPMPQRIQPEPPPTGAMEAASSINSDLQAVLGVVDPAMRIAGNTSGKALLAERSQNDNANYHYYDNLTRSIRHCGKIILDLLPHYYDTQRVLRIIGDDGRPDLVTINDLQATGEILNDITVGQYDIVMDTGPGYETKRQESLETFTTLLQGPMGEELAKVGADLVVRLYDAPGMETLADRLAAANPLAQIDEKSDIPPQVQMQIKQLQTQLQQAQQQLQAAGLEIKFKHGLEQMRQQGENQRQAHREENENRRELMRLHTKAHDVEESNATKRHDTQTKALTARDVEEIKGLVTLLSKHLDIQQFEQQADREERSAEATGGITG